MLFNSRKNTYVAGEGPIKYLDGSSLARPLDAPRQQMMIMGVFVVVAVIIGAVLLFNIIDAATNSAARAQAGVEENLSRPTSMESLPSLPSLIGLDGEGIKTAFANAGYTVVDQSVLTGNDDGTIQLIKLPADVSPEQAGAMYLKGVAKLSAADATLLLNGSWQFTAAPGDALDMRVKYADFSSGSVDAAVKTALVSEGLDTTALGQAGVDDLGNTFQSGTIEVQGTVYQWQVSALPLSSKYDISGLPETAAYVGIRLYQ